MAKKDINNATGRVQNNRRAQADFLARMREHENRKRIAANTPKSEDTLERIAINNEIVSAINEGKGRIEILKMLNEKFPSSNLAKFFGQYIDHHLTTPAHRREVQQTIRKNLRPIKIDDDTLVYKSKAEVLDILISTYPDSPMKEYFEHEINKIAESMKDRAGDEGR